MTLFLPLEASAPSPATPSFISRPTDPKTQVAKVIKTILKAKRIVVICGAGISVKAGIPDFRSPEGLFQTLKRDNPKDALSSGKDLFDASVFSTEHKTSLFCQMISRLSDLSEAAEPTSFHHLLRALDTNGRLLRVYTQNIDAIESKSGLSFGVPEFEPGKRNKLTKPRNPALQEVGDPGPSTAANRTPRCIPLHGTLQTAHCQICTHSFPLSDYLPSFASGVPPECPECTAMERTRQLVGKRPRGIGKLRPSVVLYNEAHKDGEGVGDIVQKDLIGSKGKSGADLLLVVGTSLRVPGTKRMVREFAKAVHARGSSSKESTPGGDEQAAQQQQQPLKAIYLNLDFPVPTREWEGVFDAWVQGDAQEFAQMLQEEMVKEARAKEVALERRKKREEEIALAALSGVTPVKPKTKVKANVNDDSPAKKRKVHVGGTADFKRRKLVVEIATPPRSVMQPYYEQTSQLRRSPSPMDTDPLPSPISPTHLTFRIPPRPKATPEKASPSAFAGSRTTIHLTPSTPVKKSSTIGKPPPTPDPTPARENQKIALRYLSGHPTSVTFNASTQSLEQTPMSQYTSSTSTSSSSLTLSDDDDESDSDSSTDDDLDERDHRVPSSYHHHHLHQSRGLGLGSPSPSLSGASLRAGVGSSGNGWQHQHQQHHEHSHSYGNADLHRAHPVSVSGMNGLNVYHTPLSASGSRSRRRCVPMLGDLEADVTMIDVDDFKDRLGTSCVRTTQVKVGDGG